ncbi:MAG TPA: phosphoribosylamine--glycine ligase [Ferruginibacter sp.]|nr:phosphoribosylamine--glycine ligase [Ferruginibacter sp.]
MNILLIGGGGREHAMAWKLRQSPLCNELFVAPGNAGTEQLATNLPISTIDFAAIAKAVLEHQIDMVIVGPEEPLVNGIWDYFQQNASLRHVQVIGPSAEAARLEGSKAVAKAFMQRYGVPTAGYREFTIDNFEEGMEYIRNHPLPIVLKADGLAAGKGVIICNNMVEALAEFELMLQHSKFGEAGKKVVVEAFLKGIEMSLFVVTDGKDYVLLPEAKDYKRVGTADTGLNTGGMGAVSPVPFFDASLKKKVIERVVEPTIRGLQAEGLKYTGFLFFGLMIVDQEPFVIEYNCRMGDPETQVVLPRLDIDLVHLMRAAASGRLHTVTVAEHPQAAATVVAVSGGYPGPYETGKVIYGLDQVPETASVIFHAGTRRQGKEVLTNGGRVLSVSSFGEHIHFAVQESIFILELLEFEGMYFRKDIGYEFNSNLQTNGKA